jgi:hypothetical protein
VKKFVMDNYERARSVLVEHKAVLLKIADELLVARSARRRSGAALVKGCRSPILVPPPPSCPASAAPRIRRRADDGAVARQAVAQE